MQRNSYEYDYKYDWTQAENQPASKKPPQSEKKEPTAKIGAVHQRQQSLQNDNSQVKTRPPANKGFSH